MRLLYFKPTKYPFGIQYNNNISKNAFGFALPQSPTAPAPSTEGACKCLH